MDASDLDHVYDDYVRALATSADLRAENARLRAALEKYADDNYNGYNGCGAYARRVLQNEKPPGQLTGG